MKYILLLSALMGTMGLQAASSTTTINISGTVNENKDLSFTPAASISDTALNDGVSDFALTTVTEQSNKKAGYTVTLESDNSGAAGTAFKLVGATHGEEITYTLKYNSAAVTLVAGEATITDANDKTSKDGVDKVLSISIPADQNPAADTYSDTLTLTLTTK